MAKSQKGVFCFVFAFNKRYETLSTKRFLSLSMDLHVSTFRSFINGEWPECALDGPFHPDGFFLEFHRGSNSR